MSQPVTPIAEEDDGHDDLSGAHPASISSPAIRRHHTVSHSQGLGSSLQHGSAYPQQQQHHHNHHQYGVVSASSTSPAVNGTSSPSSSRLYRISGNASPAKGVQTSTSRTSPVPNRLLFGAGAEPGGLDMSSQDLSTAVNDGDTPPMAGTLQSSLARHSSMPVSRGIRRGHNPGAPWDRRASPNEGMAAISTSSIAEEGSAGPRHRSNTSVEDKRLSASRPLLSPPLTSSVFHPASPPRNSGFVVTSRPSSMSMSGDFKFGSTPSGGVSAHSRSQSTSSTTQTSAAAAAAAAAWASAETVGASRPQLETGPGHHHSFSLHSTQASNTSGVIDAADRYLTTLNRSSSNSSYSHSRGQSESVLAVRHSHDTAPGSSSASSTSPAASPLDPTLLRQNNPWSPTPEEKVQLSSLTVQSSTPNSSLSHAQSATVPFSIDEDNLISSPRRNNSAKQSRAGRTAAVTGGASGLSRSGSVKYTAGPQRRNTPLLAPLVTNPDTLYDAAQQSQITPPSAVDEHDEVDTAALLAAPGIPLQSNDMSQALRQKDGQRLPSPHFEVSPTTTPNPQYPSTSGSRILRGPVSASPFVPPIGHTHRDNQAAISPDVALNQSFAALKRGNTHGHGNNRNQHNRGFQATNSQSQIQQNQQRSHGPVSQSNETTRESVNEANANSENIMQQHFALQQAYQQQSAGMLSNTSAGHPNPTPLAFPSLFDMHSASAQAFQNNLIQQQMLLAQQTQALQEQQAQLAAALAAGLSLRDGTSGLNAIKPLPNAPYVDPYAIAARIEALQKANIALAAGQHLPPLQQTQPQQMSLNGYAGPFAPFSPLPLSTPQMSANPSPHLGGASPMLQQNGHVGQSNDGRQSQQVAVDIAALVKEKNYNPVDFHATPANARFFVIKSFTEDDVFKSIKHEIWSSTPLGNNRLDKAFKESSSAYNNTANDSSADGTNLNGGPRGPIFLFFSVNASGHFCGVAEMLTALDYSVSSDIWAQGDKWKGTMKLRWIYIRDIPNPALRHLKLTNTSEMKPVTSSRDTQEVPYEQGCEMLRIFMTYPSKTTLLQDFAYYQSQSQSQSQTLRPSPQPQQNHQNQFHPQSTPQMQHLGQPDVPQYQHHQQQQQQYRQNPHTGFPGPSANKSLPPLPTQGLFATPVPLNQYNHNHRV